MATLYILEQGTTLAKADERLVVRKGRHVLHEVPAHHIQQIVIFGNAVLTSPVVQLIFDNKIDVAYLSQRGTYRGRLQPRWTQDAHLRQAQYLKGLDQQFCLNAARGFVTGKLWNMSALLQRQRQKTEPVIKGIQNLQHLARQIQAATTSDELRGYEGSATASYFRALKELLQGPWGFEQRRHRPPTDPINALLSLGYTLLYNSIYALVNIVGLDPYQGFYHQLKRGHACLVSDLMEEWRPLIVDSLVLRMANRGALKPAHFRTIRSQVRLTREGLQRFLRQYDHLLMSKIRHPVLAQQRTYRSCIEEQIRLFCRVLLGQAPMYTPFHLK